MLSLERCSQVVEYSPADMTATFKLRKLDGAELEPGTTIHVIKR